MTVASRIATGSGLLVLLLAGVLAYHVDRGYKSAQASGKLGASHLPAAALLSAQENRLEEIDRNINRFLVLLDEELPDVDYIVRGVGPVNDDAQTTFALLGQLPLSTADRGALREIETGWRDYLARFKSIVEQNAPLEPELARRLWSPVREDLTALREQARRLRLQLQATSLEQATRTTGDVEEAKAVSWGVVALALGLCVVIVVVTVRSINRPLNRLIEATRAVSQGKFFYQLDLGRDREFKPLADAFNSMVRRLSEIDQMKKDFVAHVSHELKNPLVAMQETNQVLADELAGPLNERQKRLLTLNIESGRRLSSMLSNLLDLSSLEAGAMSYELKATDVAELLRFAVSEFEARARERRIELRLQVPAEGLVVPCDRNRMIQVLENLLDNAIKFSPAESAVELSLAPFRAGAIELPPALRKRLAIEERGWVAIRVADHGPGVPDNQKLAIFRRFHQVGHNARTHKGGVGLGLAICRELVEAHGGAIWATDGKPKGSVFTVLLPAGTGSPEAQG